MTTTPDTFSSLIQAAQIKRVYWVDDDFSGQHVLEDDAYIRNLINCCRIQKIVPSHAELEFIVDENRAEEVIDNLIQEFLDKSSETLSPYIGLLVNDIRKHSADLLLNISRLRKSQVELLKNKLPDCKTLSLQQWFQQKSTILQEANSETLFLIDRDFSKEQEANDYGETLLVQLCQDKDFISPCILLTHMALADNSEELRRQIAFKNVDLPVHRFCVLSKSLVDNDPENLLSQFSVSLRKVLTHLTSMRLFSKTIGSVQSAMQSLLNDMALLSVEDIDKSIFQSSLEEGCFEVDVIRRLIDIELKKSYRKLVHDRSVITELCNLRDVRKLVPLDSAPLDTISSNKLKQWRLIEVRDEAESINFTHSPLACGDIFCSNNNQEFVLLAQPCDLILRPQSPGGRPTRKLMEGTLVLISQEVAKVPHSSFLYDLGVTFNSKYLYIDFRHSAACNLKALELCVLNSNGELSISFDSQISPLLLPHWKTHFTKVLSDFNNQCFADLTCLSLSKEVPNRSPKREALKTVNKKGKDMEKILSLKYGITRSGRFNAGMAQAILASFASYHARAALDNNFAASLA